MGILYEMFAKNSESKRDDLVLIIVKETGSPNDRFGISRKSYAPIYLQINSHKTVGAGY